MFLNYKNQFFESTNVHEKTHFSKSAQTKKRNKIIPDPLFYLSMKNK